MISVKKTAWLQLLLVGLLAFGLTVGCDELLNEEEDDLGDPIPSSVRGTWVLFASATTGSNYVYDVTGYVDINITLSESEYSMDIDGDVTTGRAAYLEEGGFAYFIFEEEGETYRIQLLLHDGDLAILDVEVGGGEPNQTWIMARGTGIFAGIVTDQSNYPISGATVTVTDNDDNSTAATATTVAMGAYATSSLTTDDYTITVTADGYEDEYQINANSGLEPTFVSFNMTEGTGGGSGDLAASYELWWSSSSSADYDFYMSTPEIGGTTYTVGVFSTGS